MKRVLPLVLLCACSSSKEPAPTPSAAAFVARFSLPSAKLLDVPFPSDLYKAADGSIALPDGLEALIPSEKGAGFVRDGYAKAHGFGVYAGALFALDGGAPDPATLSCGKGRNIEFVDLDAKTSLECQAAWNDDNVFDDIGTTPVLVVRPARGVVVPEGHRVAVLLTSGIHTEAYAALGASPAFASVRDGPRNGAAETSYGAAIDASGVDKSRVVAAAVYTTDTLTKDVRDARDIVRALPAPVLKWGEADVAPVKPARFTATTPTPDGWTASLDALMGTPNKLPSGEDDPDFGEDTNPGIAHDAIGSMGVAVFDAPSFLVEGVDFGDPNHHTLKRDASGRVVQNGTAKIWVTFVVPNGAMPASGWPVVVFQHGLGGQRGDALALANSFAHHGWATAAIEPVMLSTRGLDAGARGDEKSDYARKTSTYAGPDGFIDTASDGSNGGTTDLFGGLYRIAAMRDQFRQSVVDHVTLLHVLQSSPTLDGLAEGAVLPKIDGSKTAYIGSSLGGILGGMLAGVEPGHRAFILNVPGAGVFTELAPNSPQISGLLTGAAALFFGLARVQTPPHHPLASVLQHVIDGGDPIAYVGSAKGRNVVVLEAMRDEIVSNESTEAFARAMGIPVVKPHGKLVANLVEVDGASVHDVPSMGATAALIQLSPAEHGYDLFHKSGKRQFSANGPTYGDPAEQVFDKLPKEIHFENPYLQVQAAVLPFIAQAFEGKAPELTWTLAPAPVTD